jgi:hypothetical protein
MHLLESRKQFPIALVISSCPADRDAAQAVCFLQLPAGIDGPTNSHNQQAHQDRNHADYNDEFN